jgi:hypothetical protein
METEFSTVVLTENIYEGRGSEFSECLVNSRAVKAEDWEVRMK